MGEFLPSNSTPLLSDSALSVEELSRALTVVSLLIRVAVLASGLSDPIDEAAAVNSLIGALMDDNV